jgi:hypothetical protein
VFAAAMCNTLYLTRDLDACRASASEMVRLAPVVFVAGFEDPPIVGVMNVNRGDETICGRDDVRALPLIARRLH